MITSAPNQEAHNSWQFSLRGEEVKYQTLEEVKYQTLEEADRLAIPDRARQPFHDFLPIWAFIAELGALKIQFPQLLTIFKTMFTVTNNVYRITLIMCN